MSTIPHENIDCQKDISLKKIQTIRGTGDKLVDLKKDGKPQPWNKHKNGNRRLFHLYTLARLIDAKCISKSSYAALEHCASYLLYKIPREGISKMKLKTADFCKARLCPMCNWRKSLKMFGQATKITNKMLEEYPTTRFIFVTFTLKNCTGDELDATIKQMNDGFSKLTAISRKYAFSAEFKKFMLGYMRAIEVTYNKETDTYHLHIHAIFAMKASYFTRGYIKQSDWQLMWQTALDIDYMPIVHVQTIKPKRRDINDNSLMDELDEEGKTKQALVCAVAETAKYPVKMDGIIDLKEDVAIKVIIYLSNALRGKRLVTFGGLFASIRADLNLEDIEDGDLVNTDGEDVDVNEVLRICYQFNLKIGCYVC